MHKVSHFWVITFICLLPIASISQNRYAVLVGVDDYYDAPNQKSHHSLKGCVNDAISMKELLVNRFGFSKDNIYSLYNQLATKKNLLEVMRSALLKCKAGDAFVFFYSGHGVWMKNSMSRGDKIKHGLAQAIVMSDLYSESWNCLVRDETLKEIINKFIDKKVIVTSVFDCCYSQNLAMMSRYDLFWGEQDRGSGKDIDIDYLPFVAAIKEPVPCKGDQSDTLDSDGDRLPDCIDWELHSVPGSQVDEKGIAVSIDAEEFYSGKDEYYSSFNFNDSAAADVTAKAFDISTTISVNSAITQQRPVERTGSSFLTISATTEYNKGLEITDISGLRHGAFTAALIHTFENVPVNTPVETLVKKLEQMMHGQSYTQGITYYSEGNRDKLNLFALDPSTLSPALKAKCLNSRNGIVVINKGINAGVLKGNIFTSIKGTVKNRIQVIEAGKDTAKCKVIGGTVLAGDTLERTDAFIISSPRVKVYIPSVPFTPVNYESFVRAKVVPLAKQANYVSAEKRDYIDYLKEVVYFKDARKFINVKPVQLGASELFTAFVPPPAYLAEPIKQRLRMDQNISVISDSMSANLVLMINYSDSVLDNKPGYILYFNSPENFRQDFFGNVFQPFTVVVPTLNLKGQALNKLKEDIRSLVVACIRKNTSAWLNTYPRR